MKLLKFDDNYADEFDVCGLAVYSDEKYEKWLQLLNRMEFPAERYFGTNEYLEWKSKQALLRKVSVKTISEEEAKTIQKLIISYGSSYGAFVCDYDDISEMILQHLSDEEVEAFDKEFYPEDCENED